MEGFQRLFRIYPNSAQFDLDRLTIDPRQRESKELHEVIRNAQQEFRRDGAAHVWSTYKIIRKNSAGDILEDLFGVNANGVSNVIDATMNDTRAKTIIGFLDHKKYFRRIKFIVRVVDENGDDTWIIRDKNDPILYIKRKTIWLSNNSRPGMLTGVDIPYYAKPYPVTSVVYGIYRIKNPKLDKLAPMRVSSQTMLN